MGKIGKDARFEDRFLSKLGKIDPSRIHEFLARLLSRKSLFESVFDHLNEGVIVTDEELRIVYSNRFARLIMRWPRRKSGMFGEPLDEHCPEGGLKRVIEAMRERPRPIEAYEVELGSRPERQVQITTFPLRAKDMEGSEEAADSTTWVFILTDTTERRRRMEEQARGERLASLALLTSGLAHEIKNPINSLNIHAQILMQDVDAAKRPGQILDVARAARAARVILEETERLTRIVDEFILAARPQRPIMERRALNEALDSLIRLYQPVCEQADIELIGDFAPDLPPIDFDPNLMFQALRNLVGNAIEAHEEEKAAQAAAESREFAPGAEPHASGESPKSRRIMLRARPSGDYAAIEVIDNGPGIREQNLDRIFEPYYTTKTGGTGLGLMVVYRIVSEHGGAIHVDSKPGMGTRFLIQLPLVERPVRLLTGPNDPQPSEARPTAPNPTNP